MTAPRQVRPGRFYLVTRRCTQRQFLMRPDRETNNAFVYCLGEASRRFGIDVLLTCAMSNHHHTVVFDRDGMLPAFTEHFHKIFAKCQNAHRGRCENLWASEQVSTVRLDGVVDVLRTMVYTATNPVKDGLVERVYQWPGINGYTALMAGRTLAATRPRHYFSTEGTMPAEVTLTFVIPPELGDADAFLAELRRQVAAKEEEVLLKRRREGVYVLGRQAVLRQSWRACANQPEPRRTLIPRVSNCNRWARIESLQRDRQFLAAYRTARSSWALGIPIPFPIGTYWLRRFAHVPIAA